VAEVLRGPAFASTPVRLPGPGERDPELTNSLETSWREGHDSGWREGFAAGRADLNGVAANLANTVEAMADAYRRTCAQAKAALAASLIEIAEDLVIGVLGHRPDAATAGLVERLGNALALIDDGPLTIVVHPSTLEVITPVLDSSVSTMPIEARADERLRPGEARIEGPWASAELTWPKLVEAARQALAELAIDRADAAMAVAQHSGWAAGGRLGDAESPNDEVTV